MFENRTEKELIIIYALIALLIALGFTAYNISPISSFPKDLVLITIVGIVLFACMFYILYLPIKVKKSREKEEKSKKEKK